MLRFPFALVRNLFALLKFVWVWFWFKVGYLIRKDKQIYVTLTLDDDYDFGPPPGLAQYFQETPSLLELDETLERIGEADAVDGIVVEPDDLSLGLAQSSWLTARLDAIRESGKHVVAHGRSPTTRGYLLATAADDILMTPAGRLYTFGPRFDQFFGAGMLERLEVEPQFIHIGDYKTANHRMIHRSMTEPQEVMMRQLHGGLTDLMRRRISDRRPVDEEGADQLFAEAPLDARRARRLRLVDHGLSRPTLPSWLLYPEETTATLFRRQEELDRPEEPTTTEAPGADETTDEAEEGGDDEQDVMMVDVEDASAVLSPTLDWSPLLGPSAKIATMDLSGMIVMPGMQIPTAGGSVINPDEVIPRLREIRSRADVEGLILHVNSPGGSALASELIAETIDTIGHEMPVVAYCSDVAASGGYYLASAADRIVSHRVTMTGSIGVVTGKISASDAPEHIDLNVESIYEHEADTFTSLLHPLSPEMMERMNEGARDFYRRFLRRVGRARDLPRRRLHRYARGRVYFGEDAFRRQLVDDLGDFHVAHDHVCSMANLSPDETEIDFVPHGSRDLKQFLGLSAESIAEQFAAWAGESVPTDELIEPALVARMLQEDHVLALCPHELEC